MALRPFGKEVPLSVGEVQDEINRLFDRFWHQGVITGPLDGQDWAPAMDLLEEPDRFVVTAELAGLSTADVDVSVSGTTLRIKGHKSSDRREGDDRSYLRSERRFGSFDRTISLPANVDGERVKASSRQGVLEIVLPKEEASRPRSIKVSVEDSP